MKTKVMKSISKRIMTGFLAVAMVVTGIVIVPKVAEAAETPVALATAVYFATTDEYKISEYWSAGTKKVPVKAGYVFGGWYVKVDEKDVPLKQADLENGDISSYASMAYAKFVPAEVLSIKIQVGTNTTTTTKSMRILSTVDSTNYQEVGFQYKLATDDTAWTENITKVYSAIRPYKGATATQTPDATFVKNVSKYFIAADVSSISEEGEEKIVYARPFWITMDGTKVVGLARNNRVVDYENDYECVGINLLTDGKASAMVAAGKIQVTYNAADYDVVGTDITADDKGGTYLFPEMECHVDEAKGTITFVGNADIKEGKLDDLLADGLFANVKFKQTTNTANAKLNFAIKTEATDFCNWAENSVEGFVVQ